ncbi:polymorphic toxin type 15 domain-containing protein [Burkholderia thailandensis]|uniref:polymorphic toxin type 15 domain-containing protein n=1 Tax=Burkholderia thailandensis TaxID=57975 RepID=UPI003B506750
MGYVHTGLDVLGAIPEVGALFDGANGLIYVAEGNMAEAAISGGSAVADLVPGLGTAGKAVKYGVKGAAKLGAKEAAEQVAKQEAKVLAEREAKQLAEKEAKELAERQAKEIAEQNAKRKAKQEGKEVAEGEGKKGAKVVEKRLPEKKVPCFHPFDKKKFAKMSADEQKAYLKEMAKQLKRQEAEINGMTAAQYKAARDAFAKYKRNPLADGKQASFRRDFEQTVSSSIRDSLINGGMGVGQAKAEAAKRTAEVMDKLAALHEPDQVAGGWMDPDPKKMGRKDVNSSIGGSWNQDGRVGTMDSTADDAIRNGRGNEKMNVKLEPCRGKGLK